MKLIIFTLLMVFVSVGCSQTSSIENNERISSLINVKAKDILGIKQKDLERRIGKADYCEVRVVSTHMPEKTVKVCSYKNIVSEVYYSNNYSDWVIIEPMDRYVFSEVTLGLIGLEPKESDESIDGCKIWNKYEGINKIFICSDKDGHLAFIRLEYQLTFDPVQLMY